MWLIYSTKCPTIIFLKINNINYEFYPLPEHSTSPWKVRYGPLLKRSKHLLNVRFGHLFMFRNNIMNV